MSNIRKTPIGDKMKSHANLIKVAEALDFDLPEQKHKTGPKKYRLKSLAKAILFRYLLRLSSDRDLARKLKNWAELRRACGLKTAPHTSTLCRARNRINLADIFYQFVKKAKELNLIKGSILSVDSTPLKAYRKKDEEADLGYCAAKDEWIFGYKAHIVSDAEAELPIAVVMTPANDHDSTQFIPLMRRVLMHFTYEVNKLLADSGYDATYIRKWLREHQIDDIIDRNKRRGKEYGKPKDPDYNKRAVSERVNSHAKDGFALERFTFAGLQRAFQHTYACLSAMLSSAIACFTLGMKDWRKLVI